MRYLQCGLAAEGPTDQRFLGPLLHRLLDSVILRDRLYDVEIPDIQPVLPRGRVVNDPTEVSKALQDEYAHLDLLFYHSDAKGNPAKAYTERVAAVDPAGVCAVVGVVPRHETEAWIVSQPDIVAASLGVDVRNLGVSLESCRPDVVERNQDPRAMLRAMITAASGRGRRRARRADDLLGVWAQRLDLVVLDRLSQGHRLREDTTTVLSALGVIRDHGSTRK